MPIARSEATWQSRDESVDDGIASPRLSGTRNDSVETGTINVLISRRNKSLTVTEVEEQITDRIAAMEIEDEVNILIATAIDNLSLDDEITEVIDPKLLLLETKLTVQTDDLSGRITSAESDISLLASSLVNLAADTANINETLVSVQDDIAGLEAGLTSALSAATALSAGISVDEQGNIKMGTHPDQPAAGHPSQEGNVAVVEIATATTTTQTAFVVNQQGDGDIADFRSDDVSVVNIGETGRVTVVGELRVDGRIMACSGESCGTTLDEAVDETMGDLGVEGKVVAGSFEGYCADGFVWVPGSAKYGTLPGFCVMERKAGQDATSPHLAALGTPLLIRRGEGGEVYINISQGEAALACQSLGSEYHLISENEWLTIAENIIKVKANDIDLAKEGLQLATTTPTDGFKLTNEELIYDFVGEVAEWTDQVVRKEDAPQPLANEWQEYYAITSLRSLGQITPPYYLTDEANNIGKIKTGLSSSEALRGFVRGYNGIYGLDLSLSPTTATSTIGFRCAR